MTRLIKNTRASLLKFPPKSLKQTSSAYPAVASDEFVKVGCGVARPVTVPVSLGLCQCLCECPNIRARGSFYISAAVLTSSMVNIVALEKELFSPLLQRRLLH